MTLVTGAGGGIGRAICVLLGAAGHRLALVGRTETTLEETSAALGDGAECLIAPADLARADAAEAVVKETVATFGRIDALVNNAAIAEMVPIGGIDEALIERTFAVNAFAPLRLVSHAWPVFVQQGAGCVVNVSSWSTIDPFPGLAVYAASKAALESLTRSVAAEGADLGIESYSVQFGAVETAMLRGLVSEDDLPRERVLAPDDAAQVIVDCIEGRRRSLSGQAIPVPSP